MSCRDLLDPRRLREECRRRPRRDHKPGPAERRRARLRAVARPTRRNSPTPRSCSPMGSASRAGSRVWSKSSGTKAADDCRDARASSRANRKRRGMAIATGMPMPIHMPGNQSRMRKSMSPISVTRWSRPIRPGRRRTRRTPRPIPQQARCARSRSEEPGRTSPRPPPPHHHHPRRLRIFQGGLRHRFHRPSGRFHRIRKPPPRTWRKSSPRSKNRKSRPCSWRMSATRGCSSASPPKPGPRSAARFISTP